MTPSQSSFNWLAKAVLVLDPYERQARLSPAALCLAPVMVLALSLYSTQLWSLTGLTGLVGAVGLMYLLADVARSLGKRHEARLWKSWGGSPSTQVLRHRDDVFDRVSKRRYHEFLEKKVKADFPKKEDESADPAVADAVYAAGCNWLKEATRDHKKFALLYSANVNYGYRRNGFGLRWFGLAVCFFVVAWVLLRHGHGALMQRFSAAPNVDSILSAGEVATLFVSVFMAAIWLFYFSEDRVREAAFSYAQRLIAACEVLSTRSTTRTSAAKKAST